MANISESSVVVAIRDWQWTQAIRRKPPNGPVPMPVRYVGLSKHAEYKLGDYITEQDERLLLIEVKATIDKINDEWKPPVKNAFTAIGSWLSKSSPSDQSPESVENLRLLRESVQCHHFVFYEETPPGTTSPDANLMLMPYLTGMATRSTLIKGKLVRAKRQTGLGLGIVTPTAPNDPPESIRYRPRATIWLDNLPDFRTRLIDSTSGEAYWDYLGLPLDAFQDYVNAVCAKPEPLSAIVMSLSGSFLAHFKHTNDLKAILGQKLAPNLQLPATDPPSSTVPQSTSAPGSASPPALALATPSPAPLPSSTASSARPARTPGSKRRI